MSDSKSHFFSRHKNAFQLFFGFVAIYIACYLLVGNWAHWKYRLGVGPEAPFGLPIGTLVTAPFLGALVLLGYMLRNRWQQLPKISLKDLFRLSLYMLGSFVITYLLFRLTVLIPLFRGEDFPGLINPGLTALFASVALGVIILTGSRENGKT